MELEYKELFCIAFIGQEQTIYGLTNNDKVTIKKYHYKTFTICYLFRSNHSFVVAVLLMLLLQQCLLILAVRDSIITVGTYAKILEKSHKILFT